MHVFVNRTLFKESEDNCFRVVFVFDSFLEQTGSNACCQIEGLLSEAVVAHSLLTDRPV